MKNNNPFKGHDVDHLSASSINLWIANPSMWTMTYLFNIRDKYGESALRGNCVENNFNEILNNKNITQKQLEDDYNNLCIENQIDHNTDPAWSERNSLVDYINQLKKDFKYTNPKEYQKKIEINYEDLPVPIIGYIDFIFEDVIVDLKTTKRCPSTLSHAHARQMSIYHMAYDKKILELFYCTPKKTASFIVTNPTRYKRQIYHAVMGLQRFLSFSSDKYALAHCLTPDFDDWRWSEYMKNEATKIWSFI